MTEQLKDRGEVRGRRSQLSNTTDCGGVEVQLPTLLTFSLGRECLTSRTGRFISEAKVPNIYWTGAGVDYTSELEAVRRAGERERERERARERGRDFTQPPEMETIGLPTYNLVSIMSELWAIQQRMIVV